MDIYPKVFEPFLSITNEKQVLAEALLERLHKGEGGIITGYRGRLGGVVFTTCRSGVQLLSD